MGGKEGQVGWAHLGAQPLDREVFLRSTEFGQVRVFIQMPLIGAIGVLCDKQVPIMLKGKFCSPVPRASTALWAGVSGSQEESGIEDASNRNAHAPVYELLCNMC